MLNKPSLDMATRVASSIHGKLSNYTRIRPGAYSTLVAQNRWYREKWSWCSLPSRTSTTCRLSSCQQRLVLALPTRRPLRSQRRRESGYRRTLLATQTSTSLSKVVFHSFSASVRCATCISHCLWHQRLSISHALPLATMTTLSIVQRRNT